MQYTLKYPCKGADGDDIKTVSIRGRVLVSDMMYVAQTAPNDKVEAIYLTARMLGLQPADIERFDLEDYNTIYAMIMGKPAGADKS